MAISFVDKATANATTVTIPAGAQVGDLLVIFAFSTSSTIPTLPTGWAGSTSLAGTACAFRVGYRFAQGSDTSGTWTNAAQLIVQVYRGVTRIGTNTATKNGTSSTASFSAIALNAADGSSWNLGFIGSKQVTSTATPSNLTNRDSLNNGSTSSVLGYDSNAGVTSWNPGTSALGASAEWLTSSIEMVASKAVFADPGGDSTFDTSLLVNNNLGASTAVAVSTAQLHGSHIKSYLFSSTGNSYAELSAAVTANGRFSVWVYVTASPNTLSPIIILTNSAGTTSIQVQMDTNGTLQLWNKTTAQIGSTSAAVATNTWTQISLAWVNTASSVANQIELWINGSSQTTATNTSWTTAMSTASNQIRIGNIGGNAQQFYGSDFYIDGFGTMVDVGAVLVTAKRPNANGTSNQFTTQVGAGGSGYGSGHSPQVNERALSTTNGWSLSLTTLKTEEYSIESKSTGDIDISSAQIVDFIGWIDAKESTTSNTPVSHLILAGTTYLIVLTTSAAIYMVGAGSATYPAGNTDIGMDGQYTSVAGTYSLLEAGVNVAYIVTSQTITPSLVTSTATVYAPTIAKKYTITPSLVAHASTVYAPTVKGLNTITPSFVSRSSTVFAPTIAKKYTITPSLVTHASTVYAPTMTEGAVTRTAPFVSRTATVFAPTMTEKYTIHPSFVSRSATVYAPTMTEGAVTSTAPFVSRSATVYDPTVFQNQTARASFISRTATVYAPTIAKLYTINSPFVSRTATIYAPTMHTGAVTITPAKVTHASTVYAPSNVFNAGIFIRPTFVRRDAVINANLAILTTSQLITRASGKIYMPL